VEGALLTPRLVEEKGACGILGAFCGALELALDGEPGSKRSHRRKFVVQTVVSNETKSARKWKKKTATTTTTKFNLV
jgi:hypothetical protein